MTCVRSGDDVFLHASDVQGPMSKETTSLILKEKPDVLVLGGPPSYLKGVRVDESSIRRGMINAAKIARSTPIVLLEHHILRSEAWRVDAESVYDAASEAGHQVMTAAEFAHENPRILEAGREELYAQKPPSPEFMKWTELKPDKRRLQTPPI
jgi:predicted metallo-beta-lactamase superfamily hydrolase